MKVAAVFTLILAAQASASVFDGFQSSFVSVENSFGRLLSDVVSDVKVTIDCTVVAVENALSLGGLFGDHSKYERMCKGEPAVVNEPEPETILEAPTEVYDPVTIPPENNEKQSVKREIQSSTADVDNTVKNIIDISRPLQGLETVKTILKKDTTVLDTEGSSLTKQLDDITSNVKKQVEQIGGSSGSAVNEILDRINILHKVADQKDDTESSQIRHAFDEVMDAIHSNSTAVSLVNDNAAKEIMKNLEQTSNDTFTDIKSTYTQFRNKENKQLDELKHIVERKNKDLLETKPRDSINKKSDSYDLKEIVESKTKKVLKTKPDEHVNKMSNSYDLKDLIESKTKDLLEKKAKETVNEESNSYELKAIVESKTKDLLEKKPKETVTEVSNSYDLKAIVESKTKDLLEKKAKETVNEVSNSYDLKAIVESKTKDLLEKKPKETVTEVSNSYDLKAIVESKTKDLLEKKPKELVNEVPKSFKSLAQQIMVVKPSEIQTTIKTVESVAEAPKPKKEKPPEHKNEPTEDTEMLMFNSYFGSNGQDANTDNEVMSLMERSMYSEMLMSEVSSNNDAVSVFDNPELLNYR